jgi:DNA-directed RNA polymerase
MTKTDRPVDIYATVASDLIRRLGAQSGDPIASLWLASGLVTRSIVKRPVMTLPYGATRYGFVDQILQTLREKDDVWNHTRKTFGLAGVKIRVAVQYLSGILWETLQATVGGALSAMQWLQTSVSQVTSVTGGPIGWTVPLTSFPAYQEYWTQKRTQITTRMNGTILQPQVYTNTHNPHHRKIRNSIAPNVVHSLDAAAMQSCVVMCAARGVTAFSAIHDSYATHAEAIPVLSDCIRTSFIDLHYDRDILGDLAAQWRALGADIPDPPTLGTFDIRDVRQSGYFFN